MTLQVILSILLTYPLNVQAVYTPSEGGEGRSLSFGKDGLGFSTLF